ncbi:hypothetical protein [Thalassotalea maritima]|uniref:hypothetical protein n=1 Tax=Thalassotalea maritima TaxID=3242416 RepID=UPI0035295A5E
MVTRTRKHQQGVALILAIIFLVALTSVISVLLLNTSTDIKMASASQEKVIATQQAIGANDEVIYKQTTFVDGDNGFAYEMNKYPADTGMAVVVTGQYAKARILRSKEDQIESDCPHSRVVSSIQVFRCNMLKVESTQAYGKKVNEEQPTADQIDNNKYHKVTAVSGIAQQLLAMGN